MGVIVGVGAAIISAVSAAAAAVASVIVAIAAALYAAVIWIAGAVIGLFAGLTAGVLNVMGVLSAQTLATICVSLGSVSSIAGTVYFTAASWVATLAGWFKTFLDVIHFKTLKTIHDIAYIVSADYREYVNKIYGKIAEFSQAISGDAFYAVQLLQNARAVVLSTSSMLGRPYDLGEVTWIHEFENILTKVQQQAEVYKENPYELINDLNDVVMKPSYDLQGEVWSGIFETIDVTIKILDRNADNIARVTKDFQKLVADLPESLRNQVSASVMDAIHHVDQFMVQEYQPTITKIQGALNVVQRDKVHTDSNLKGLVDRLKNPADYLREIDNQGKSEQLKSFELIADYSTRIYRQPVEAWREFAEPYTADFMKVKEIVEKPKIEPEWTVKEEPLPSKALAVPSTGRASPFPEDV